MRAKKSIKRSFVVVALVSAVALALVVGAISVLFLVGKTDEDASEIMNLQCGNEAASIDLLLERMEDTAALEASLIEEELASPAIQKDEAWFESAQRSFATIAKNTNGAIACFLTVDYGKGEKTCYMRRVGASREIHEFERVENLNSLFGAPEGQQGGWDEQALREGNSLWLEPSASGVQYARMAAYVMPIMVNGVYRGAVGIGIDFQVVIDQIASIKSYQSEYGFLTDAEGNVMYHPTIPAGTNLSNDDEEVPEVDKAIAAGTTTGKVVVYRYHNTDKRMAFHKLRNGMRLVLSVNAEELYSVRNQLAITLALVSALAALVCAIVSSKFARRALVPLEELTVAAEHAAEGKEGALVSAPDVAEVQRLARAHNRTVERLNEQVAYIDGLARLDVLTGLPNRNAYAAAIKKIENRIKAGKRPSFSLIMLDVNNLKDVNDAYGHDAGDDLLVRAAQLMSETFAGHTVYRIGGDEFTAIVEGRLDASVAGMRSLVQGDVSIACGCATFRPDEDEGVDVVLARADGRMYKNKRAMKGE